MVKQTWAMSGSVRFVSFEALDVVGGELSEGDAMNETKISHMTRTKKISYQRNMHEVRGGSTAPESVVSGI